MQLTRRSFLKSMVAGTGLILAAPAIVRAESLMKIYVPPPKDFILPALDTRSPIFKGDTFPQPAVGALYLNTQNDQIYIYTGVGWCPIKPIPFQGMNVCTGMPFDTRMVVG